MGLLCQHNFEYNVYVYKIQELCWHFEVIMKLYQQENLQIVQIEKDQYTLLEQSVIVTKALLL